MAVTQRTDDWAKVIPPELSRAIEAGELTQEQLRQLITIEAQVMGLSFDDAVSQARSDVAAHGPWLRYRDARRVAGSLTRSERG